MMSKSLNITNEKGKPLTSKEVPLIVGARKIMTKPLPGEKCYVPPDEKLKGPYGDIDPSIYSSALGMQITENEQAILDRFAMKPFVFEQCNKLDDATAQATILFE